jgi:hypothetical protein
MILAIFRLLSLIPSALKLRSDLVLENLALRQQLRILPDYDLVIEGMPNRSARILANYTVRVWYMTEHIHPAAAPQRQFSCFHVSLPHQCNPD